MRWLSYFIFAYLVIGFQLGTSGYIELASGRARPDFMLLAVIWIAINAPRDAALLGCFGLGLIQDFTTVQAPGVYAFSYGLVAMLVVSMQKVVYREHPLTHFGLALTGCFITSIILIAHGLLRGPRTSLTAIFYSAIYTSLLAPILLAGLAYVRRLFSFQTDRWASRY